MKTIISLPAEQLLVAAYDTAEAVEEFMHETELAELRKVMPEIPEGASGEETEAAYKAQWRKNVKAMVRRCLKERPEATVKVLRCLVIPEDGEELNGFGLLAGAMEILNAPQVLEIFFKSVRLALETFDD